MTAPTNGAAPRPVPSAGAPSIAALVEREARRLRTLLAAGGASVALAAATLLLALGAALFAGGRWIALPAALPALLWVLAIGAAVGAGYATWRALAARGSRGAVAGAIERERALRSGALRGALEVADSGALGRRAADDLARRLSAEGPVLAPALQRDARRRAGGLGAVAIVAFLLLVVSATGFADGWAAVGHPISAWRGTLLPRIGIEVPHEVLRGERARLRVAAPGRREVTLRWRATGAGWESETHPVRDGHADVVVGPVRAAMTFVATDGRATSDTAVVRATDRPFVGDVALRAVYPDYLHRRPEPLASGEVARLPRGTAVVISGRASSALRTIGLAHGPDTVALRPDGHRFDGRLIATTSGTWAWSALGISGPIADLPAPLELEVLPDSAPRVDIASPTRDSVVTPGDRVTIALVASDDHGLGVVALRSWRQSESGQVRGEVTDRVAAGAGAQWSGTAMLDVGARDLEPGDALHVVAVATDESPWAQRAVSRELVLRVPSLSEQRQMARRAADSAVVAATELASAEKALQQRTNEAARARDRGASGGKGSDRNAGDRRSSESGGQSGQQGKSAQSPLSYQRAEQAKALSAEQRALSERVKQLQDAAKSLEKQLAQAGALDSGLAARLAEAQRMLRDALTPELQAQLAKLEQAAQGLDGDQARQSLGDLAQQQQKLREQLERSAEMLKRAALEGAMQTLRDEARELAERQRNLADSLGRGDRADASPDRGERDDSVGRDDAEQRDAAGREDAKGAESGERRNGADRDSRRAKELAQRSRDLSRDVADLEKRLRQEGAQTGAKRADAAQQHAQASADALQKAGQQAGSQEGQSGKESARKAAGEMDQAAQQLAEAREQQVGEWKQELTKELDQSIQEMLQLSRSEEQLAQQTAQGQTSDAQGQQSSIQQGVEKAGQRLQKAGQKSSLLSPRSQRAMGEARQKVQQATKETAQAAQDAAQQSQPGGREGGQEGRQQKQSGQQAGQQPGGQQSGQQPGGQQQGGEQAGEQPGSAPSQTPAQLQAQSQAMREAAEALNRAAASLVRDRERANSAKSASGLPEMIEEMNQLAQQQGALNQQAEGLSMMPGGQRGSQAQAGARALGQKQRGLAQSLEGMSESDESGRTEALAREAKQIAEALERGAVDPATLDRQQRLYHRLLEAGKTLEQDERDDTGKREARAASGTESFTPGTDKASGKAATRFREPTWSELRGLSAEERRLVLEYFKRLNAQP